MNRWAIVNRPLRGPEVLAVKFRSEDNGEELMKNKYQVVPQAATQKPAKVKVSDAEFRRRLKNISEWRKRRLAQLRARFVLGFSC